MNKIIKWVETVDDLHLILLYTDKYYPAGSQKREEALICSSPMSLPSMIRDREKFISLERELRQSLIDDGVSLDDITFSILNNDSRMVFGDKAKTRVLDCLYSIRHQ